MSQIPNPMHTQPTQNQPPLGPGYLPPPQKKGMSPGLIVGIIIGSIVLLSVPCLALLAGIMLPALGKARGAAMQLKDSTQLRGMHQGMVLWGQNNADRYPEPGILDAANNTLGADVPKDLPRHITSILIYNSFFSPDLCISPAEVNPNLAINTTFAYVDPASAAAQDKRLALWDPSFKAYPGPEAGPNGGPGVGGLSYAMSPNVGARRGKWANTFSQADAMLGNRGPAYISTGAGTTTTWTLAPKPVFGAPGVGSNTLLMHGGRTTWEGNIAYNDNSVMFETSPAPPTTPFAFSALPAGSRTQLDHLFVNEDDQTRAQGPDDLTGNSAGNRNNLLKCWTNGTIGTPETGKGQVLTDLAGGIWGD